MNRYRFQDMSLAEFHARVEEFNNRYRSRVTARFVANGDLHLSHRDEENTPRLAAMWRSGTFVPADDQEILRDAYGVDLAEVADFIYEAKDEGVCADISARYEANEPQPLLAPQSVRRDFPSGR